MKYRFGIVCSRYHPRFTDALLESARQGLSGHEVELVRVPGAFEIPWAVQKMAKTEKYHAVLALGLIWQGETDHADLIANESARGCMQISLETGTPVIFEVLTVRSEDQAVERCLGDEFNRGREAAQTALAMAALAVS
jgi:6,7-dimethyl-8-ribityllumazine synthase